MNFASDNTAPVHPKIMAALEAANSGHAMAYGSDAIAKRLDKHFADLFERPCAVFLVATGTAANSIALAAMAPPWGAVYCHPDAHINTDECGAPEFYTGGAKLVGIPGKSGKIDAPTLAATLAGARRIGVHQVQPAAVSITNATEAGTVYAVSEIAALAEAAHRADLKVHLDGARFANALVHQGASPAEATWRAGVDILSFGATKNGCMAAEAIVVFDEVLAETIALRRKRAGHLFSKMRYLAAQLEAYLADDLWLVMARHANALAQRLAHALATIPGAKLAHKVEANEIFVELPEASIVALEQAGFAVYRWNGSGTQLLRLVVSWSSRLEDADRLAATALAATSRIG
jgi:threonine aldolase